LKEKFKTEIQQEIIEVENDIQDKYSLIEDDDAILIRPTP
jgi:hypothetical protein